MDLAGQWARPWEAEVSVYLSVPAGQAGLRTTRVREGHLRRAPGGRKMALVTPLPAGNDHAP